MFLKSPKPAKETDMLNAKYRRELLKDCDGDEPAMPYVVLAKCVAGLAIVAGIALIGLYGAPESMPPVGASTADVNTAQAARQ
jgi:hypothetical protein